MSYVTELEEDIEAVTTWAYDIVNQVVDVLAPDGRQFELMPKTEQEQIDEYLKVRGNLNGWTTWIQSQAQAITESLKASGLDDKQMSTLHPWDMAINLAARYSAKMEAMVAGQVK